MITLITGTPGAGKTLYAISKLMLPLIGTTVVDTDDDGVEVTYEREVFSNINGLQVAHVPVGPGGFWSGGPRAWSFEPLANTQGLGLRDWHLWAQPGAAFFYDEFQKVWPPRPNGSPVPPDLQALDTHRHMGVDFILPTQNPNNFDRHLQGLVGRHLHVRRLGILPLSVIYEWDHCSRQLMYSKAVAKSFWWFDKKVYKLYKSARVHTVQKRKLPTLTYVSIVALVGAVYFVPSAISKIKHQGDKLTPVATQASTTSKKTATGAISDLPDGISPAEFDSTSFIPRVQTQPNTAPAYDELRQVVNMPRIVGVVCAKKQGCKAVTEQGTDAGLTDQQARDWMASRPYDAYTQVPEPVQSKQEQPQQPPSIEPSMQIKLPPEPPRGTMLSDIPKLFPPS